MATDKRILKTRASIKNAFMQLAFEKDAVKISVSDIAARALVNRSTFYLHYADVTEVAEDIEREIAELISASIDSFDVADIYESTYKMFVNLTDTLNGDEILKKYIIFSTDSNRISGRIKQILVEKTASALEETFPNVKYDDTVYPLTFASAGLVESYVKWERSSDAQKPLKELIKEGCCIIEYIINKITSK